MTRCAAVDCSGKSPGQVEDFLTGFLVNDGSNGQITAWGRPVGLILTREGSLLVSDDTGNRIFKVSYNASRKTSN